MNSSGFILQDENLSILRHESFSQGGHHLPTQGTARPSRWLLRYLSQAAASELLEQINLANQGVDDQAATIEGVGVDGQAVTVFAKDVGNKQSDLQFVPCDPRRDWNTEPTPASGA